MCVGLTHMNRVRFIGGYQVGLYFVDFFMESWVLGMFGPENWLLVSYWIIINMST